MEPITDADDPRLRAYRDLKDAAAKDRLGVFIAEGRFVVRLLLADSRFRVRSVFVTPAAHDALRDVLEPPLEGVEVLLASQHAMGRVVGFDLHRGCLAVGERGDPIPAADVIGRPGPVVILENVNNHDNVGGVFRSAAALGAAGVLLSPGSVDPLYRKAIRVSMGGVLRLPFATADPWPGVLGSIRGSGRVVAALTPSADAIDLDAWDLPHAERSRVAWLVGAEGPGLTDHALNEADVRVRIPMTGLVDSLNVATASAIALHWSGATGRGSVRP